MGEGKCSCTDDILCGIKKPDPAGSLTELEQKHLPVISAPRSVKRDDVFDVTVEVGKLKAHPHEPAHFIEWIEVFAGETFLARVNFSGSGSYPRVTIPIQLNHACGPLKVTAKCNIHGAWIGEAPVEII